MSRTLFSTLGLIALISAGACRRGAVIPDDGSIRAKAYLLDTLGRELGTVKLTQKPGASGVDLEIDVSRGATPGQHGIHFHTVGSCVPAKMFEAAGGHFNPTGRKHGLLMAEGPHAGDLEAITVDYMGKSHFEVRNPRISLSPGPNSLLDADGSSIVLHALPDDQRTDPSGGSGNRIACGVIVKT